MDFIKWNPQYNTNIEEVDKQHRGLVDIINLTSYAKTSGRPDKLKEVILKLVEYTKVHFAYEENHMSKHGYLKIIEHKAQHQVLIKQVIHILEQLKAGDKEVLDNIFHTLESWLIKHVKEQDRDYALFYEQLTKKH